MIDESIPNQTVMHGKKVKSKSDDFIFFKSSVSTLFWACFPIRGGNIGSWKSLWSV